MARAIVSRSGVSAASSRVSAVSAAVAALLAMPYSLINHEGLRASAGERPSYQFVLYFSFRGHRRLLSKSADRAVLRLAILQRLQPLPVLVRHVCPKGAGRRFPVAWVLGPQQLERLGKAEPNHFRIVSSARSEPGVSGDGNRQSAKNFCVAAIG